MADAGAPAPLDERTLTLLTQECDRMLALYGQTQAGIQSTFNFYMTFVTAVIAGVIFIAGDLDSGGLFAGGVLLFAALVGTVYLSSLSGRYAHAGRYAEAADHLRRMLLTHATLPTGYSDDLRLPEAPARHTPAWLVWLVPTGTYAIFVATVNSVALAGFILILGAESGSSGGATLLAAALVFFLALFVHNAYSHLVMRRLRTELGYRIAVSDALRLWASRM